MAEVTPHDKALVESWSKDMDGILIFVRLCGFEFLFDV